MQQEGNVQQEGSSQQGGNAQQEGSAPQDSASTSCALCQRILAITATYPRAFQELYFTRLAATVRLVAPPFLWIVVESPFKTSETASVLERTAGLCLPFGRPNCARLEYVHLETGVVGEGATWPCTVMLIRCKA